MYYKNINLWKSIIVYTNTQRDHKTPRLMKQTATVTAIGNTDRTNFFFLFLTGDICMGIKTQRHDKLAKPPCSAPHENYLAGVDQNFV